MLYLRYNNKERCKCLKNLQVLFINYTPTVYSKTVEYYLNDGLVYNLIDTIVVNFTNFTVICKNTIYFFFDV